MSETTIAPYEAEANMSENHAPSRSTTGLLLALCAAAAFGSSGAFGKSLIVSGWTPGAVVLARVGIAALVMLGPTLWVMRGRWAGARQHLPLILAYGAIAVAGCQLTYFIAISYLSVGVALLIEYTAPLFLVALAWARTRRAPARLTILGSGLAIVGLALVINVFGDATVNVPGVLWALAAALGVAFFFLVSARPITGLPPVALAGGGLIAGTLTLGLAAVVGVLPMAATTAPVQLAGRSVHWWVPVLEVALVAAAFAYAAGIAGARRLGATVASFVGLTEVIFAVVVAWLLLGEQPGLVQLAGGLLIVGGVIAIRVQGLRDEPSVDPLAATASDGQEPLTTSPASPRISSR